MIHPEIAYAIAYWDWLYNRSGHPTALQFKLDQTIADAIARQVQIEYAARCRAQPQEQTGRQSGSEWVENWKP